MLAQLNDYYQCLRSLVESVMKNSQKFETRVFRFFYVHSGEGKKMENFTNVPVEWGDEGAVGGGCKEEKI